jgi:SAM-dependent methyltransferase
MGIDPYIAEDIYYPNGISIKKKDLGKVEDIFDLIMFHHSFEHLPNPLEVLVKIKRILGPGGALLIRMPTVNSFSWRHYRENWVNLDAPRHFFLQSIQSMQILAEKTGYSIKEYRFISTAFQFLGSEQYIRDITLMSEKSFIKGFEKSIFLKEDEERYEEKAKFLNSTQDGDEICYYLSKAI